MTPRICIECDHRWTGDLACPECGSPGEPLPKKRGRPPKGTTARSVRREIRMEPGDAAALDGLRLPGETRNDADLRVLRVALKSEGLRAYSAARRSGTLAPCDACEDCGTEGAPLQGHHENYMRPLDVVWLCLPCHYARHGQGYIIDDLDNGELDWPVIVFPGPHSADRVQRSKYRKGQMPSGRKMLEWAKAHDLCFTIDADGLRCERLGE